MQALEYPLKNKREWQKKYDQKRNGRPRVVRSKTLSMRKISRRKLRAERVTLLKTRYKFKYLNGVTRPETRGDCVKGPRPCPYVGCRHNLYLDVNQKTGSVKFNYPDLEPHEMPATGSCSLDVADAGRTRLDDLAMVLNVTRERVRQIEVQALEKLYHLPVVQELGGGFEGEEPRRDYAPMRDSSAPNLSGALMRDR
jgi:hypothetical protein